jgi:folylpolyglutamate synthase
VQPSDFDRLNPIHIAGTKGKGSTSSFISSILAQYLPTRKSIHAERLPSKVGLYTSPHLRFVRERIKIDNEPISEELFASYFWEVWDRLEASQPLAKDGIGRERAGKPVYFHYLTLMALHCYLQEHIGTAVIECGIGGEFDTTNILRRPSATGITSLGIDHEALLGDTIEQIAWHKAGIFKEAVPAFTVPQPATALEVLHQRARERNTKLCVVPVHTSVDKIELGLQGHFQKLNASLAIAVAASHLQRLGFSGLPDPYDPAAPLPDEFVTGLESTRLGGRCDQRADPTGAPVTWYIDGGHTLESIEVAGRWFAKECASSSPSTRCLIFNQQTRDASSLAKRLHDTLAAALDDTHPFTHAIFCPNTTYRDAGYKPDLVSMNTNKHDVTSLRVQEELAVTWRTIDPHAQVHVLGTIEEAVSKARELTTGDDAAILATGSLHLVGGLIEVLESQKESGDVPRL